MRELIQGLLQAEAEARSIVQSAREEAEVLVADAEKHGRDLAAQARQTARTQSSQTIEIAAQAAMQEKKKRLEDAISHIQAQVRMDEEMRDRLVEAVVRCVCGQS